MLLGPAEVRRIAADLGLRPTKRLGQNYVIDPNTVRRIVRTAQLRPHDVVVEVGPGLGSLTLGLLGAAAHVIAVEIDPLTAGALPATVQERAPDQCTRLTVRNIDALALGTDDLAVDADRSPSSVGAPTALVANLPYNVAVPVLLHLLATFPTIEHGLVMVQAEVADRLAAAPGSRTYGVPTVKTAWWAAAQRSATIARSVFWPVPNVDSALVRLVRHDPPPTAATRAEVFALVDAAFAQRRKSLRAALAGWAGSPQVAESMLRAAGIASSVRGESLTVADFARLAEAARAVRSMA
ncbi:MAG TPA: 16S rRNA (adenine(1518)-N(6)/adenine(1519)-N(6))-dimethyltransferase RsmA [Mycobacteriales bacterium]|nr:16S rRNA (adenine(1518)-N(6)/adenine(1519)-N(6))-dimethyltransferase RsmA [Mycobacteriales bacterium]